MWGQTVLSKSNVEDRTLLTHGGSEIISRITTTYLLLQSLGWTDPGFLLSSGSGRRVT